MKKLSLILALALCISMLAGCAGTPVVYYTDCTCPTGTVHTPAAPETPETDVTLSEGALKTGIAILASAADSSDTGADANGKAKYDVAVVAVTVDGEGIIHDCIIDSVGTEVAFDAAGKPVDFDPDAQILTKNELGDNYNMKLYAGSKYEWYEQAAALADYAVGKTVAELRNGAVNESGMAADADLASTATIYLGGYVEAIDQAAANAKDLGAQSGDQLKLAINSAMTASAEEAGGSAELTVDVVALTMNGDTITSCVIDSVQAKVVFDGIGVITSGNEGYFATKNQLGADYNMVAWGGAIAEWDQQAASFAAYVTGKTAADVMGIAVTETTAPAEGTDLATSVTIKIGGFQALIQKAAQ